MRKEVTKRRGEFIDWREEVTVVKDWMDGESIDAEWKGLADNKNLRLGWQRRENHTLSRMNSEAVLICFLCLCVSEVFAILIFSLLGL